MPLDVPKLDDLTFQDLVDEAKRRIPQLCSSWTDHNVSDLGITLIELFAYMTEQYLYRLNQVPEKNYIAFLNLLGELKPPRAARGAVTFTLTRPLDSNSSEKAITIKAGTEVATSRSSTDEAVVFTTDREVQVLPPTLKMILTQEKPDLKWVPQALPLPSPGFPAWPGATPATDKARLALGFEQDLSAHTLALIFDCASDQDWSCEWQVHRSPAAGDNEPWARLDVQNSTKGLSKSRAFELSLPTDCLGATLGPTEARTWVRCLPTADTSPMILSVGTETRGITVPVTHAQVIENEVVGTSDGQPGQSFSLLHHPILAPSDPDYGDDAKPHADEWVVEVGGEPWRREEYFLNVAKADEQIYVVDPMNGRVQFAPEIRQENGGKIIRPGAIPELGQKISIRRYRIGGGEDGNVNEGQMSLIKRSLPGVKDATNRFRTWGGRAAQTLKDAKRRVSAPARERERLRAVTAEDFEVLARQVPGVGWVRCLPDPPGTATLLVIPELPDLKDETKLDSYIKRSESDPPKNFDLALNELHLPTETSDRLQAALKPRLLLGSCLKIQQPVYVWVRVSVTIIVSQVGSAATSITQEVKRRLYRWFNPIHGGVENKGWELGRPLREDKIWRLISETPGVEDIFKVDFFEWYQKHDQSWDLRSLTQGEPSKPALARPIVVPSPRNGIIAGMHHDVHLADVQQVDQRTKEISANVSG